MLKSGLYEDDWSVRTVINIDAGQLDEIASNIKQFFSCKPPANKSLERTARQRACGGALSDPS